MKHLKKESRRDKETHVLGVEDLGRHHGLSDPLELAQPLHHDLVDSTGLFPPAERQQAGPEVVQQAEEDPKKERMKETKNKAIESKRREEKKETYVTEKSTPSTRSRMSA